MRHHGDMGLDRPHCYVASPLGFTTDGRRVLHDVYLPALRKVVTPINPWDLTHHDEIRAAEVSGQLREFRREMARRNAEAIEKCPLLVAYLEGQELDSGTVAEIGYASALGKRCFGIRSDERQTGETKARVNMQVEYFITRTGGDIVDTMDRLLLALRRAIDELGSVTDSLEDPRRVAVPLEP